MSVPAHIEYDFSDRRRVLLVSDVHGEYRKLFKRLAKMKWDPERDVLIINGDLADRGSESEFALKVITMDGIYRTLGNHEEMPRMFLDGRINARTAKKWGGEWFADKAGAELRAIADAFEAAPVAMTIRTPIGRRVGIIHADCLPDWNEHISILMDADHPRHREIREISIWKRDTVEELIACQVAGGQRARNARCTMTGIDHVFHGHTPFDDPFAHDDRSWIDTGACYDGAINVISVDDWIDDLEKHSVYR